MTDEKMSGGTSQASITKETQVLPEHQVRPISGIRQTAKRKNLRDVISAVTGLILGFLL